MGRGESGIRTNRSLVRGLEVLSVISAHGPVRASEISRRSKLPRATVVRLIETLLGCGMIRRDEGSKTYEVAEPVTRLSRGYNQWSSLAESASDEIEKMAAELTWPLVLTTPSGLDMVVRYNTDHSSPLALQRYGLGYRIPIFDTASGMVFLASCSEAERQAYLRLLDSQQGSMNARVVTRNIAETERDGYCIHHRAGSLEKALAVAILQGNTCPGALTMRYIPSAVGDEELKSRYVQPLKDLAARIAGKLDLKPVPDPLRSQS